MIITPETLLRKGLYQPCSKEYKRFKRKFPQGAELTLDNLDWCKKHLNILWFVYSWLTFDESLKYSTLHTEKTNLIDHAQRLYRRSQEKYWQMSTELQQRTTILQKAGDRLDARIAEANKLYDVRMDRELLRAIAKHIRSTHNDARYHRN